MIAEILAMVDQYREHASFYDQHCDDALDALERGDDYSVEYYRDLQDDEYDAMIRLELEFERLNVDLQEML